MTQVHIKQIDNTRDGTPQDGDAIIKEGTTNVWSGESQGSLRLPQGSTLGSGVVGNIRYDTTLQDYVVWDINNNRWVSITTSTPPTNFNQLRLIYNSISPSPELTPSGDPAIGNVTITTPQNPKVDSVEVMIEGIDLDYDNFSVSSNVININTSTIPYPINNGDNITVRYAY